MPPKYPDKTGKREQEDIDAFTKRLKDILKYDGISMNELHYLSAVKPISINSVRKGEGYLKSFIRILSVMGYEAVFIKTKDRLSHTPESIKRMQHHKGSAKIRMSKFKINAEKRKNIRNGEHRTKQQQLEHERYLKRQSEKL